MTSRPEEVGASPSSRRRSGWIAGVVRALPVVAGYVPIGFTFGALAIKAGLSSLNTLLMSVIVYAGASQLIAVGLLAAGAQAHTIVVTTFAVNLRHLVLTSALAPYLVGWRRLELAAFAYEVTDETFGVHTSQFARGSVNKPASFATNICAQCAWLTGTGLGVVAGHVMGDVRRFGLDFALPAMFVALLTLQIKTWAQAGVALASLALAGLLLTFGVGHWTTPIAAAAAAAIGVGLHSALEKRGSEAADTPTSKNGGDSGRQ